MLFVPDCVKELTDSQYFFLRPEWLLLILAIVRLARSCFVDEKIQYCKVHAVHSI